jgi:hypothetical protein
MKNNQIILQDFPKLFETDDVKESLVGFKVVNTFTNDDGCIGLEFDSDAQATMFKLKWL